METSPVVADGARGLRRWLLLFFLALSLPAAVLVYQALGELKWQVFHQHRLLAEELVARIDGRLNAIMEAESARAFTDYTFLNILGSEAAGFLQRSDLSAFPVKRAIPGVIGYFQVDAEGVFSTPLLPETPLRTDAYGIDNEELRRRRELAGRIRTILSDNRLVSPATGESAMEPNGDTTAATEVEHRREYGTAPSAREERPASTGSGEIESGMAPISAQAAFDLLGKKKTQAPEADAFSGLDLRLEQRFQEQLADDEDARVSRQKAAVEPNRARKERSLLPAPSSAPSEAQPSQPRSVASSPVPITIFESELNPFELDLLDSGHLVLYRQVWRDGQRFIQGALIETQEFLHETIEAPFKQTALSRMSRLQVSHRGRAMATYQGIAPRGYTDSKADLQGQLLLRSVLSPPLNAVRLVMVVTHLPPGPGSNIILWTSAILALVLSIGCFLLYRLGLRQLELAAQQQDFVSAVSHELKTPLTSIRMYGEMLQQGWVPEDKRRTYYDYIFNESERLSRLIENVLQLARMTRRRIKADLKPTPAVELMQGVRPGIQSLVERAGFSLEWRFQESAEPMVVDIDSDYFTQIMINLVDNATKFASSAETRVVEVGCARLGSDRLRITVRDFGPGVARDQAKKIFGLFYRSDNALTRETSGTGIGLALVREMVVAMKGRVDVVNRKPGAEFRLTFQALEPRVSPFDKA